MVAIECVRGSVKWWKIGLEARNKSVVVIHSLNHITQNIPIQSRTYIKLQSAQI